MNDFKKRKKFIKINCGIISALFVAILFFMGFPIVSDADSPTYLSDIIPDLQYHIIDQVGYLESTDSPSSNYGNILIPESRINSDMVDGDTSNGEYKIDLGGVDPSDYPYKFIVSGGAYNYLFLYFVKTNDFYDINLFGGYYRVNGSVVNIISQPPVTLASGDNSSSLSNYIIYRLQYSSSDTFVRFTNSIGHLNTTNPYSEYIIASNENNFNYCNFPLYDCSDVNIPKNNMNINNIEQYPDVNYLLNYSPEPDTYPDGSGGDSSNNLYMRSSDWKFNIPKYWGNVTSSSVQPQFESSWGSGSILFYGLLNDYQKAHASDYNLNFNFHIWCSGHYFSDVNSNVNGNFYGSFNYNNASVSLTNFINNNNTEIWSVNNIFDLAVNSSGVDFNDWLNDNVKGHNSINNWNWYITCDASLVSSGSSSGHINEKYNFISQVSEEVSNNITTNTNPYVPPSDSGFNPDVNNPSSDNGSTTTTTGNGNITINNNFNPNNTNNVSNEMGGSVLPNLMNILSQGKSSSVAEMENITNSNGWLNVMKSTYDFIPSSIWVSLGVFFVTALGILIVGFVLSVVIKFIT